MRHDFRVFLSFLLSFSGVAHPKTTASYGKSYLVLMPSTHINPVFLLGTVVRDCAQRAGILVDAKKYAEASGALHVWESP